MPKLKKLSVKSNMLTDREKKAIRGAIGPTPVGDHCGAGCKSRCGTKAKSDEGQYEALN